jgi:hypothetical protein
MGIFPELFNSPFSHLSNTHEYPNIPHEGIGQRKDYSPILSHGLYWADQDRIGTVEIAFFGEPSMTLSL